MGSDDQLDTSDSSSFSSSNPIMVLQYPTGNITCESNGNHPVAGEVIPIELNTLILANVQTNVMWISSLLITLMGIGVFLLRKK